MNFSPRRPLKVRCCCCCCRRGWGALLAVLVPEKHAASAPAIHARGHAGGCRSTALNCLMAVLCAREGEVAWGDGRIGSVACTTAVVERERIHQSTTYSTQNKTNRLTRKSERQGSCLLRNIAGSAWTSGANIRHHFLLAHTTFTLPDMGLPRPRLAHYSNALRRGPVKLSECLPKPPNPCRSSPLPTQKNTSVHP